jgi:hypothetical protein
MNNVCFAREGKNSYRDSQVSISTVWIHFKAAMTLMKSDMDVMPIDKSMVKVVPVLN